jgi:hypothetical protein
MSTTLYIHGPIICCAHAEPHLRLLNVVGMSEIGRRDWTRTELKTIWGVDAESAIEIFLAKSGTKFGARLLQISPTSRIIIRDPTSGYDADAPKVIDFYTPDFDQAIQAFEAAGFPLNLHTARYTLPEGEFREAHFWGPDNFVYALITGPATFFDAFATVTDQLFSEPQSLSGPVSDRAPVEAFFKSVFDLDCVYAYTVGDDSFREMVGAEQTQFKLTARNIGTTTKEPYFGLIHYGMPRSSYRSLFEIARLPNLGLIGASIIVSDVAATVDRASAGGYDVVAGLQTDVLPNFGSVAIALLRGPNGGTYQVIQELPNRGSV